MSLSLLCASLNYNSNWPKELNQNTNKGVFGRASEIYYGTTSLKEEPKKIILCDNIEKDICLC